MSGRDARVLSANSQMVDVVQFEFTGWYSRKDVGGTELGTSCVEWLAENGLTLLYHHVWGRSVCR